MQIQEYDPLAALMSGYQTQSGQYAQAMPGGEFVMQPAGQGVNIGVQDPGMMPPPPMLNRVPFPTNAPRPAPVEVAPQAAPQNGQAPAPRPNAQPIAPDAASENQRMLQQRIAAQAPRATGPTPTAQPVPSGEDQGGGMQIGGRDVGDLLRDFMAGLAGAQGGGLQGGASAFVGASGNRQSREDRKRAELSAAEEQRLKMEDRAYGRSRDSRSDARADQRLALDMENTRTDNERAKRTASLTERKSELEIRKLEREADVTGVPFSTILKIEDQTNEYAKRLTPSYGGITPENEAKVDSYRQDLLRRAGAGRGDGGQTAAPAPAGDSGGGYSDGQTATNPATGEKLILRNNQWVPAQ